jgi:hypothetical protein
LRVQWTRRDILPLALLAAAGAPLAAACSGGSNEGADNPIRQRAEDQAAALAALYGPAVSARFAGFRAHHLAHRAKLLGTVAAGGDADASGDANANVAADAAAPAPTASAAAQLAPSGLAAAEHTAMTAGAADLPAASGPLTGLLVNIAACRALHCAALGAAAGSGTGPGTGPRTGSTASTAAFSAGATGVADQSLAGAEPPITTPTAGDLAAAQAILSAEHAAVYAYGALTPHLRGTQRDQAHGLYELHRQLRDALETGIAAHGATPAAAVAAYTFPHPPTDPASAVALASYVESRVAAVCANAAAVTTDAGRPYASWSVTEACLRAYAWGAPITAFPATLAA